MKKPSAAAMAIVDQFSFSSNVIRNGRMIGLQYVVAEAIDLALQAERERCADVLTNRARTLLSKRRTNKLDRHAVDELVRCRDKINGDSSYAPTEKDQ